jgi:UDP-N-acetylglucosamine 2-epimerase (non-hydrolysing)
MIPDRSVDFVFSFDSLVHAEAEVIRQYLLQISKKLRDRGGGFIHHSTLGDFPWLIRLIEWSKQLRLYRRSAFIQQQEHWRAYSMTASLFQAFCTVAELSCTKQELVNWVGTQPDYDLQIMRQNQSLSYVTAQVLCKLEQVLNAERPDWVLVQGDTTTTMAASLEAYYQRAKIGHVEAGLRTRNKFHPFPEEINRRIGDVLADLCFAPTEAARQNLIREGVPESAIRVTGNAVVDALLCVRDKIRHCPPVFPDGLEEWLQDRRMVLVTGHRRESFGAPLEAICLALHDLAKELPEIRFVYPVHLNPNVQIPVHRILSGMPNVRLIDPLPYGAFARLMERASVILTDSGGVQEEAPSLGKPVLVMRETTERPEGIAVGSVRLANTDRQQIVLETRHLLQDSAHYEAMAAVRNPYGDGRAAHRIVEALLP